MGKNIKNYIHLYLGAQIRMYNEVTLMWSNWRILTPSDLILVLSYDKKIEVQLRPLADMTDYEKEELDEINERHWTNDLKYQAARIRWHLSKHFDLFSLIDSELAIDKTKIKSNDYEHKN
jgi:hypothetical protein